MVDPTSVRPRSGAEPDNQFDEINVTHAFDLGKFFMRAAGRGKLLIAGTLLVGAGVTAMAAFSVPRAYKAEAKILTQRQVSIPLLASAPGVEPMDPDAPARAARETRTASETVLRRDNLASIVEETKLVDRWESGRAPIHKLVASLRGAVSPSDTSDDTGRALVGVLEKRIGVKADDTTITLSFSWHDPEVAHEVIACTLRNFLKDRSALETAATTAAIKILEDQIARQRETVEGVLTAAEEAQRAAAKGEVNFRRRSSAESRAIAADDTRITTELDDKRRAIQIAEDARQHLLSDLLSQRDRLRQAYTPEHPAVLALEERLRHARAEPPDLAALKRQEAAILARLKAFGPKVDGADPIGALEQPKVAATRIKLIAAVNRYEELTGRLDAARLELNAAQATFKDRYVIAAPPEPPLKPEKPAILIVALVGALLSLLVALAAPGVRELARGRFVDAEQVRRRLPLRLLAEVEEP